MINPQYLELTTCEVNFTCSYCSHSESRLISINLNPLSGKAFDYCPKCGYFTFEKTDVSSPLV